MKGSIRLWFLQGRRGLTVEQIKQPYAAEEETYEKYEKINCSITGGAS